LKIGAVSGIAVACGTYPTHIMAQEVS
jgi:hypothetical protein